MWKVLVILVALAVGVVGWLWYAQVRPRPMVVSGFVEADQIRVGSRVGGRIQDVFISEGQRVRKGEPLFRVEAYDLKERLARAEAEAAAARAELAKLKTGYRPEEIEQVRAHRDRLAAVHEKAVAGPRKEEIAIAREKLKIAQANYELAQAEHKRVIEMAASRTASQNEVDQAVRQLKKTQSELVAAELELALLQAGTRREEIAEARAALAEAEAAMKLMEQGYRVQDIDQSQARLAAAEAEASAIRAQVSELTVIAPVDSVVEAVELQPGDIVAPNAPALSLLDISNLRVRTYIPEAQLGRVRLSQLIPIRIDGFGEERFTGRLTYIAPEAEFTPRNIQTPDERSRQVFRAKLSIVSGQEKLRVGMIGDVLLDETAPPEQP